MKNSKPLWGSFDLKDISNIPFITESVANEKDVKDERAVFYLDPNSVKNHHPYKLTLPLIAKLNDEETGEIKQILVIQAEFADGLVYIGYRFIDGGNGICYEDELIYE